jgi:tetratricopeptide (TPR) repeat protein
LLEGNMRRHGNVLRVSVQLIDGRSGLAVWTEAFDRDRRELLNLQQDIASAVVRMMLPGSARPVVEPATQSVTANELLLLGRHYEQQVREREDVDVETLQKAVDYYRRATEADPNSALARSRLAGALLDLGDINEADAQASAALLLNPELAEVQHTFGKILLARGSPNTGEPLARAVELNPNSPDAIADYAYWHWYNVGTDGVADLYQRALELDPLNIVRYAALGQFLASYDQPDEARALAEKMQAIFDGATAYRAIEQIYDLIGDVDLAIAWTIRARDAEPDDSLHVQRLAELYADIGDYETAAVLEPDLGIGALFKMRRYDELIEKGELRMIDYPEDIQVRVYLGFAYSARARFDDAIRVINTSGILKSFADIRRNTVESDGYSVLLDAAYGSGQVDEARDLAELRLETHYESASSDWWIAIHQGACTQAILGHDEEVHRLLRLALDSNRLAWEPMLKDQYCFKRFADDPDYQAIVRHFDERRALLRARLPSTLARYGVSL